jgi:hypothetical protein
MTEEEAKTKWCPQTMASDNWDKCQGTACMVWQRKKQLYLYHSVVGGTYLRPEKTIGSSVGEPAPMSGYCGLVKS